MAEQPTIDEVEKAELAILKKIQELASGPQEDNGETILRLAQARQHLLSV